jgi:hypothetical protein
MQSRWIAGLGAAVFLAAVWPALAEEPASDPFLGDWQGEGLAAQVIPRGGGMYQINLLPEFDTRCEPLAVVEARADGDVVRFAEDGWTGELKGERFTGTRPSEGKPAAFQLKHVVRQSPRLGAKPPKGAVVLFDGSNFDHWQVRGSENPAEPIAWELCDDFMRVAPTDGAEGPKQSIVTRKAFSDFRLHLEFRLPLMADKTGQARANGGLVFEDYKWYEVQILDSYGLEGLDNECGGIYKVAAPAVNMCRPPLMWQTYDVEYHASKYDEAGGCVRQARISVSHNGKPIHTDVALPPGEPKKRPAAVVVGRILLHYHHNPIEYRNIWLVELPQAGQ